MGELEGKVAIVTGSTRGIGRAIAERFAREGAAVVVHSRAAEQCAAVARGLPRAIGVAGLGKFAIRVNSLSPGVRTDMIEVMDVKLQRAASARRALKLDGTAHDVAEAALFLCSDRSRFITGDTLHVDGGMHLS